MSRIGRKPVRVPEDVSVRIDGQNVHMKGKLGELSRTFQDGMEIQREGDFLKVAPHNQGKRSYASWGLVRALLNNMVVGVSKGISKSLEIRGVGYRAAVKGAQLNLMLGYSHPIVYQIPEDVQIFVEKNTKITVKGVERERVGRVCADIRAMRPPEPYKGKGVRYLGEYVLQKEGKKK